MGFIGFDGDMTLAWLRSRPMGMLGVTPNILIYHAQSNTLNIMDTANLAFVRIIQFSILVFFVLILAAFFGTIILLPLALVYHFIGFLTHVIGFNGFFAFIFAVPVVGYIFYYGNNIPGFYQTVMDTGVKLYQMARAQHSAFEKIVRSIKGLSAEQDPDSSAANHS